MRRFLFISSLSGTGVPLLCELSLFKRFPEANIEGTQSKPVEKLLVWCIFLIILIILLD